VCRPEPGWACDYQGQCVQVVCGDGIVNGDERCDDGNALPSDGCSASCMLEPGYLCGGEPYACHAMQIGDACENAQALVDGSYGLTDYLPDYGCHNACSGPDRWFTLSVPQGQTLTVAVGSESMNGEARVYDLTWGGCASGMGGGYYDSFGASHTASVALINSEPQPRVFALVVSQQMGSLSSGPFEVSHTLAPTGCGDGYVDRNGWNGPSEACDDGNDDAADGCSAICQIELGWVCGNAMPSQCVQPPAGDMCETAETLVDGAYSLAGFSNECGALGCSPDRWLATTIPGGELLIIDATTNAQYAYVRLWDMTNATCASATELANGYLNYASPAQLVWQAPPGGANVVLQLEAPSPEGSTSFTLDARTGLAACGDGYADQNGFYGAAEQCDDGNGFDNDGCSSICSWED
jgi:large repetitive protein